VRTTTLAPRLRQHVIANRRAWAALEAARRSWVGTPVSGGAALRFVRPRRLADLLARADVAVVEFPWQLARVKQLAPELPLVLAAHNVEATKFASWARSQGVSPGRSPWVRYVGRAEARAARLADLVLTVSPEDRAELLERYPLDPGRVAVVPNGADVERYVPASAAQRVAARRALGLPDRPVALFVGAPMAANRAGLPWVRRLAEQTDRFTFLVVGKVAAPERSGSLVATGWVDDLRPCLAAASIALCPIEYGGGTKIKLLEGLAAGLPTVAFPPSLRGTDLRADEHLLVVDPDDEALAAALARLDDEPALATRLGRAGRRAIEARYSWNDSADALEAALAQLVSERARTPVGRSAAPVAAREPSPSSARATSR
jgi:glycosyltransferase involved in cell wall biosynthesis